MTGHAAPLKIQSKLAETPQRAPQFSVELKWRGGQTLRLADPKATRAMVALMDMEAGIGGAASHYGGPSAFAELMSATHALMFHHATEQKRAWHELFHFVNDAGHCENGLYALKANYGFAGLSIESLKSFRSIHSPLTGHGEAHLFPEGVLVSNGPLGSSLPQAQGLAMADASSGHRRTTICALSDGAAMEGEAKEALAAIPGLAKKNKLNPFVLIISDNRTKLSGRIDDDAFSMEPSFQSLTALGWRVITLEDGHDLQACVDHIDLALTEAAKNPKVPVAIHARTIKGKGSAKAEASATGGHGFPLKKAEELPAFLKEIYAQTPLPEQFLTWTNELLEKEKRMNAGKVNAGENSAAKVSNEKIQAGIAAAMIRARSQGLPVVSVSADLQGSTGVAEFHKAFPNASFDVGVAEANMISVAAGFSLAGFIPIVDTFAQFGVTKGALPITMANLSQAPVIAVFSHTGFQDAADGASHQALSYLAQVSSIPHVEVYTLSCSSEADALLTEAIQRFSDDRRSGAVPPTMVFFLGRENFPRTYRSGEAATTTYKLGRSAVVFDNTKEFQTSVCFAASGSLVPEAMAAAADLQAQGVGSIVLHNSCVNQPDLETLGQALEASKGRLVTVEDHRVIGGMAAHLTHAWLRSERAQRLSGPLRLVSLGVGDHFGRSAYQALDLYRAHGLDRQGLVAAAKTLLG